jgi:phosphoribosylformimino-5-aminoimidazole carboxamide ribotide isomerase
MIIFPAIDLRGGKVVRLLQGRADAQTTYGDNPGAVAQRWEREGGQFLHVVDLDGAFDGVPRNWESVKLILAAIRIPIELGGGLRTREQIAGVLAMGVNRVVVGTKACESPEFVAALVKEFGERIVVGIDARDGFVAVKGWVEKSNWPAIEFAQKIDGLGVANIIFTDVSTDGMLAGPNYNAITAVCSAVKCNVIASGGVSQAGDVHRLRELSKSHPNLAGVIVGKALYDGRIDLKQVV